MPINRFSLISWSVRLSSCASGIGTNFPDNISEFLIEDLDNSKIMDKA
jgi:hypothetical protein